MAGAGPGRGHSPLPRPVPEITQPIAVAPLQPAAARWVLNPGQAHRGGGQGALRLLAFGASPVSPEPHGQKPRRTSAVPDPFTLLRSHKHHLGDICSPLPFYFPAQSLTDFPPYELVLCRRGAEVSSSAAVPLSAGFWGTACPRLAVPLLKREVTAPASSSPSFCMVTNFSCPDVTSSARKIVQKVILEHRAGSVRRGGCEERLTGEKRAREDVTVPSYIKAACKGSSLSPLQTGQGVTGLNYSKENTA